MYDGVIAFYQLLASKKLSIDGCGNSLLRELEKEGF